MNPVNDLFLLMFNLCQMNRRDRIISFFCQSISEIFSPGVFEFREHGSSPSLFVEEINTRNATYGYICSDQAVEKQSLIFLQNSIQMLAVILERIDYDEKLKAEKRSVEELASNRLQEINHHIEELESARLASLNLIEDLSDEIILKEKYQKTLQENERKFRNYIENAPYGILVVNQEAGLLEVNRSISDMSGYSQPELLEMGIFDLVSKKDHPVLDKQLKTLKNKGIMNGEVDLVSKDGSLRSWSMNGVRMSDETFLLFTADITDQKKIEAEKKALLEQLHQSQKMEAIGTLAGGIAHDFNNILGVILGYAELSLDEDEERENINKSLKHIIDASHRAKDMVQQILAFSRKSKTTRKVVFLNKLAGETVQFLRSSLPSTVTINLNTTRQVFPIFADPTQVNQILMNLCTNSAHAMNEGGGEINIHLDDVTIDRKNRDEELKPGRYQRLQISDNGTGIHPDHLNKIFEPYFTTKKVGEGTGMGLAVVYGITKSYGGKITVQSELGTGTTFILYFPIIDTHFSPSEGSRRKRKTEGRDEQLMFVDDEAGLVEMWSEILKKNGYRVDGFSDSLKALNSFKRQPKKYDLLITDMTMPKLVGTRLVEEIHKIRPEFPVIVCTGYSDQLNKRNFKKLGFDALIMKPIDKNKFTHKIREILDKSRHS